MSHPQASGNLVTLPDTRREKRLATTKVVTQGIPKVSRLALKKPNQALV
jgi:hypothetical protein